MAALWVMVYFAILIWSGIHPKDALTWLLEVLPAMIAFVLLAATRRRFPFTPLAYFLILIHCLILMVGGHYTYAEVPLLDPLGDYFGWQRNNYDKLGHLAQGFVPAIVAREILIRNAVVASKRGCSSSSSASAWRSARCTNWSSGGWRLRRNRRPRPFSARRAMSGIPSRTWLMR